MISYSTEKLPRNFYHYVSILLAKLSESKVLEENLSFSFPVFYYAPISIIKGRKISKSISLGIAKDYSDQSEIKKKELLQNDNISGHLITQYYTFSKNKQTSPDCLYHPLFILSECHQKTLLQFPIGSENTSNYKELKKFLSKNLTAINNRSLLSLQNIYQHKNTYVPVYSKWIQDANKLKSYLCNPNHPLQKIVFSRKKIFEFDFDLTLNDIFQFFFKDAIDNSSHQFLFAKNFSHIFFGRSPEVLIEQQGNQVISHALAGTAPRGKNQEEDDNFSKNLMNSHKDKDEHAYVAQQIKEAFSRNCHQNLPGRYDHHIKIKKMPHIQHLEQVFSGILKTKNHLLNLIEDLHPTPAILGHPKNICYQILDSSPSSYEGQGRGSYSSSLGICSQNSTHLTVAIRSATLEEGRKLICYAGTGLISSSCLEDEWKEGELKFEQIFHKPPSIQKNYQDFRIACQSFLNLWKTRQIKIAQFHETKINYTHAIQSQYSRPSLRIGLSFQDEKEIFYGECAPLPGTHQENYHECLMTIKHLQGLHLKSSYPHFFSLPPSLQFAFEMSYFEYFFKKGQLSLPLLQPQSSGLFLRNQEMNREILRKYDQKYKSIKIKIGLDGSLTSKDLEKISLIHQTLPSIKLRVDANGYLQDKGQETLISLLHNLKLNIEYLEDVYDLKQRNTIKHTFPLAYDGSSLDIANFEETHCDIIIYKPSCFGGISRLLEEIKRCQSLNKRLIISSPFDSTLTLDFLEKIASSLLPDEVHGFGTKDFIQ